MGAILALCMGHGTEVFPKGNLGLLFSSHFYHSPYEVTK